MDCPDADTLNAMAAGKLDSAARAALADHAAGCAECHGVMEELVATDETRDGGGPGGGAAPAPVELERVDRYVITRRLGAGAMGVVYAARDPELARDVAIKVLRGGGSPARLKREAQMLARLNHPNVVAVHDVGDHDGHTFVAMALVDGANLRDWLATPHSLAEIVGAIVAAGRGLAAAHEEGLIHRDLKPDNIFVARDGGVMVGDFGLARSDGELDGGSAVGAALEQTATQTGMVLGTPAYMAPEQGDGEPSAASDQFSLCVTAWEALYGTRPFAGASYAELVDAVRARRFAAAKTARKVPARIRAALERGLRAEPAERWPSIDALLAAIAPPRRRWPWIAGGVAIAGVAIAVAIAVVARRDHGPACGGTAHELDAIWNAGIEGGEPAGSERTAVGDYARTWLAVRKDVCVAGAAPTDARVACLGRAKQELAVVVGVLGTADPGALHRAIRALPDLAECRNPARAVAFDRDGEALRAQLGTVQVQLALGDPAALGEARRLAAEADRRGYEPAIVDAAVVLGDGLARSGDPDGALAALRRALALAEAAHDDRGVARVGIEIGPPLITAGKLDEARTLVDLAAAALARIGGDDELELELAVVRLRIASAAGDHAAAIELARSLIVPSTARFGADSTEVAELYIALAGEYSVLGRRDDARDAVDHARQADLARSKRGVIGDVVAYSTKVMDAILAADVPDAIETARQYVAVAHETGNPDIEREAAQSLAQAYSLGGDGQATIDAYQAVIDLLDQTGGGSPADRGEAFEGLGRGLAKLGKHADAVTALQTALELDTQAGSRVADQKANAATALGDSLLELGRARAARDMIEPVVTAVLADPDAVPQRRAGVRWVLARALMDDGDARDHTRARGLADDALHDYQTALATAQAPGGFALAAPRLAARVDDITAWQKRHP